MAEKSKSPVVIEGYLKENTLKKGVKQDTREPIISGSLTLACEDNNEFKIFFYAKKYKNKQPGETTPAVNKVYTNLAELTDEVTTSFAKILKINPNATFNSVKSEITAVTVYGNIEENFFVNRDGDVASTVRVRGSMAFKKENTVGFVPKAKFSVKAFVERVYRQKVDDGEETNVFVQALIPSYGGRMNRITFVADNPSVAEVVEDHWKKDMTVNFNGNLITQVITTTSQTGVTKGNHFGEIEEPTVTTTYRVERRIRGGDLDGIEIGEDGAFTQEEINEGLKKREEDIAAAEEGGEKTKATKPKATKPSQFGTAPTGFEADIDDLDF